MIPEEFPLPESSLEGDSKQLAWNRAFICKPTNPESISPAVSSIRPSHSRPWSSPYLGILWYLIKTVPGYHYKTYGLDVLSMPQAPGTTHLLLVLLRLFVAFISRASHLLLLHRSLVPRAVCGASVPVVMAGSSSHSPGTPATTTLSGCWACSTGQSQKHLCGLCEGIPGTAVSPAEVMGQSQRPEGWLGQTPGHSCPPSRCRCSQISCDPQ